MPKRPKPPQKLGWFTLPGRLGDRTLDQQMMGLGWLFANCRNNTVLDLGCAEGLLSIEIAKAGAKSVHGVEIVADHIDVAKKLIKGKGLPIKFEVADINSWRPKHKYDISVALALLHKLFDPTPFIHAMADATHEAIVLRLPPAAAPSIIDPRSGNIPIPVGEILREHDFHQIESHYRGPFDEYVGVWRRGG